MSIEPGWGNVPPEPPKPPTKSPEELSDTIAASLRSIPRNPTRKEAEDFLQESRDRTISKLHGNNTVTYHAALARLVALGGQDMIAKWAEAELRAGTPPAGIINAWIDFSTAMVASLLMAYARMIPQNIAATLNGWKAFGKLLEQRLENAAAAINRLNAKYRPDGVITDFDHGEDFDG